VRRNGMKMIDGERDLILVYMVVVTLTLTGGVEPFTKAKLNDYSRRTWKDL